MEVEVKHVHTTKRNDILKIIAMVTMLIDHTALLLLLDAPYYIYLRIIGRIAFPIFAYQLAIGFKRTSNRKKYATRLFLFALVSQIPYVFLSPSHERMPEHHYLHFNVLFLFLYSFFVMLVVEYILRIKRGQTVDSKWLSRYITSQGQKTVVVTIGTIVSCLLVLVPEFLQTQIADFGFSYGTYGVIMVLIFYFFENDPIGVMIAYIAVTLVNSDIVQAMSVVGVLMILVLSRYQYKLTLPKFFGYAFYPIHLILLLCIRWLYGGLL